MPKDVRNLLLFLLVVGLPSGGFVLWRWIDDRWAESQWAEYVAAARSRGGKVTAEEFYIDPRLPDDENYAASPLWDRAFAAGPKSNGIVPEFPRTKSPKTRKPARRGVDLAELRASMAEAGWITQEEANLQEAEAVLAGLARFRPLFDELRSLRPRARAWYPVDWKRAYSAQFPHLPVIRNLSAGLAVKAHVELELGRATDAFETLRDGFLLASSLDSAPAFLPTATSATVEFSMLQELHAGIARAAWTDDQLQAFESLLGSRNTLARTKAALDGESALFNSMMDQFAAELVGRLFVTEHEAQELGLPNWAATGRARWWRGNQQWVNQSVEEEIAAFNLEAGTWLPGNDRLFDPKQLEEKNHRAKLEFAYIALAPFGGLIKLGAFTDATIKMGAIACALERYKRAQGRYPAELRELEPTFVPQLPRDPTTGYHFIYRRDGNSYLLYSAGANKMDDGGDVDVFSNEREQPHQRADWRWPGPAAVPAKP